MIEIHLSQHTDGRDIASAIIAGRRFQATSRNGAVMALARQLVEAGIADQPWRAVCADGGLCGCMEKACTALRS